MPKDVRSWISEVSKALINSPAYPGRGCGDEGEGHGAGSENAGHELHRNLVA
jgi:hypothetical protein